MTCRWNGSTQPRILTGRHLDNCTTVDCPGCQPCTQPHCRVCYRTHAEGTCPDCLDEARDNLAAIAQMCDALPEEVEHRGIDGEAMTLLGPTADPEARGHVEASYLAGRLPEGWIEAAHGQGCPLLVNEPCTGCAGDERHPLTVLLTWADVWRDALDHDEAPDNRLTTAVDYLDRTMSYMAGYPHVPFEDFAKDLRRCSGHLEAVLHDGEQVDTGAPCMECHVPLHREWGRLAAADGWRCPRCREWRSDQDYRLNVADLHRREATHLTDREMEIRTGVRAGTVREWARRGDVGKRTEAGRVVYAVEDVVTKVEGKAS